MKVGGPPGEVGVGENNGEAVPALVDRGPIKGTSSCRTWYD